MSTPDRDTLLLSADQLCIRIETLTTSMMDFWKSSTGWAPVEAAGILSKSKLEWQASLFYQPPPLGIGGVRRRPDSCMGQPWRACRGPTDAVPIRLLQ